MVSRIDNDGFLIKNYSSEFFNSNYDKWVDGDYIYNWLLAHTAYTGQVECYKPKWVYNEQTEEYEWTEGCELNPNWEQFNIEHAELKQQTFDLLYPTDWVVIRYIETGVDIPDDIKEQRQLIRQNHNELYEILKINNDIP